MPVTVGVGYSLIPKIAPSWVSVAVRYSKLSTQDRARGREDLIHGRRGGAGAATRR